MLRDWFLIFFIWSGGLFGQCPFCQPDVIENQAFYRGKETLAILTHKPVADGHVLIIPARHAERFEDLTPSEVLEIHETIVKVDAAIRRLRGTTGYLLHQKNGKEAGQSVPHVHFHYVPCSKGDSKVKLFLKAILSHWRRALTPEEMAPIIAELQTEMS